MKFYVLSSIVVTRFDYRVTKYNPAYRDTQGRYTRNEWTSFQEVPAAVSLENYLQVEQSYIDSALQFLAEQSIVSLKLRGLENSRRHKIAGLPLKNEAPIPLARLGQVVRDILREKFWARLESDCTSYVHFGWDFYMYIGLPTRPTGAIRAAEKRGLFVEEFTSPYLTW